MADEIKLTKDSARAARARQLLDHELITEAFKVLEDSYIAFWRASKADDDRAREKAYVAINVIGKVKEHLETVIANGTLAQAELHKLHADTERKRRFGII